MPFSDLAAGLISEGEVKWITAGISHNVRTDLRKREEFRPLKVQLGALAQATGSARVQLGETDVIVAVKVRFRPPPAGARHVFLPRPPPAPHRLRCSLCAVVRRRPR
jgi:hypothetical protein